MDTIGLCFRRVPLGDETFSILQKDRMKIQILTYQTPFLEHIKMESKNNWTTFGSAFAAPFGG